MGLLEMPRILLLSKDEDYRDLIMSHFEESEIEIEYTNNINEAKEKIKASEIDIIICDHELGTISVSQVSEIVKAIDSSIIMVSLAECFGSVNIQKFLEANIQEFICKKGSMDLLEYRIMYLVNNKSINIKESRTYNLISQAEKLEVNYEKNTIYHNSQAIHVTQLEFNLLVLFLENKNKLLKREQIIENIWHEAEDSNLRKVDSFVKSLRKKLNLKCIKSVRGQGYKWLE
ncbi:DNA-binding response OmpR family regulator [Bacilli bacterium PM5-3]|nr:DNA-binding response OmpR family regulator [Bacilli bacterium PM5-3]